jgi:hypothetical protein
MGYATLFTKQAFEEDQPRDEKGRWTPIHFGTGEFGVGRTREVSSGRGSTIIVSGGRRPEEFTSREAAARFAAALNRKERGKRKGLVRSGAGIGFLQF